MQFTLSENLKTLRTKNKLTLEDIAEIAGVSRQSVAKWESGASYPVIDNLVTLSQYYGVSLDALVHKPIGCLEQVDPQSDRYLFGLTHLGANGTIKLPPKAIDIFELSEGDLLLVVGDKTQGIAIVKCDGVNDVIAD